MIALTWCSVIVNQKRLPFMISCQNRLPENRLVNFRKLAWFLDKFRINRLQTPCKRQSPTKTKKIYLFIYLFKYFDLYCIWDICLSSVTVVVVITNEGCYRPQGKVMFSQASVSHSVHSRPHDYSLTAFPCYGVVGVHLSGKLSCLKLISVIPQGDWSPFESSLVGGIVFGHAFKC